MFQSWTIAELVSDRQTQPLTAYPDEKVQDALSKMLENDYSQLPVVDRDGHIWGIVSMTSICRTARHLANDVDVLTIPVEHCIQGVQKVRLDEQLGAVLKVIAEEGVVLVVSEDEKLISILTNYDTTMFLRQVSEAFLLLQEFELKIRELIENAFPDQSSLSEAIARSLNIRRDEDAKIENALKEIIQGMEDSEAVTKKAEQALRWLQTAQAKQKLPASPVDMTFDQYRLCITHESNWPSFAPWLRDKELASRILEKARVLRNDVMHFRRDIETIDLDELRFYSHWLRTHTEHNARGGA